MTEPDKLIANAVTFLDTHADWEKMTQEEIIFLRAKNFKSAESVMKRKAAVAERYQKQLKQLFDQKEALGALPAAIKEALKNSQLAFEKISAEHHRELELALDASRRFIELIKSTITRQATTSHFYGNSGAVIRRDGETRSFTYNSKA